MFTLRLIFSGVCAFAPRRDGKQMWVFLPNEAQPFSREVTKEIPPHRAVVKFDLADLLDASGALLGQAAAAKGILVLNQYGLEIWPGGNSITVDNLSISCYNPATGEYSSGSGSAPTKDCFSWVAPVEKVCADRGYSGAGRVDPDFLRAVKLDPRAAEKLAARVVLNDGRIYTYARGAYKNDYVVWRFRPFYGQPRDGDHRQILASEVAWDLDIHSAFVEIRVNKLIDGNPVDSIRLAPRPPVLGTPVVTVEVMNEESDRIMDILPYSKVIPGEPRAQDRVFEAFGKLSSTPPPRELMPIPVADYIIDYKLSSGAIAAAAPPCSPARMEPF